MITLNDENIIQVKNLTKWFPVRRGIKGIGKKQEYVHAVNNISFDIKKKETLGLVGESGCGKSTTGRLILGLIKPTRGEVFFNGVPTTILRKKNRKELCRKMQIIFQDPYGCLNPRLSIFDLLAEPLIIHKAHYGKIDLKDRVKDILETVDLTPPEEYMERFSGELSGGQRQRIAIGRSLMLKPQFLVGDEPVSSLDVSTRGGILKLLFKLKERLSLSMLYITHDLAVSREVCDRIAVMYLGKIVEIADSRKLIDDPIHYYTKALISAIPTPDPAEKGLDVKIKGEITDNLYLPEGCSFYPRCLYATDICHEKNPELIEVSTGRFVACHNVR